MFVYEYNMYVNILLVCFGMLEDINITTRFYFKNNRALRPSFERTLSRLQNVVKFGGKPTYGLGVIVV